MDSRLQKLADISEADKNTVMKIFRELTEYTDDAYRIVNQANANKPPETKEKPVVEGKK